LKAFGFAIALSCLLCGPALAQDNGVARIEQVRADIAARADAAAVARLPDGAFEAVDGTDQLAHRAQGRQWWRVRVAPGHGERLLLVYHPYSARVTVLAPPLPARTQTMFDADLDPRFSRRALAFPLAGAGPIYIGVEDARYPLRIAVQPTAQVIADDLMHVRVISTVVGALIGISLVVLLFWTTLRDRVYVLYALTMALQLLYLLCAYGEAYALPGLRWLARFGAPGVWAIATLGTASASFFLIDLAELTQRALWPSRLLRWVGGYGSLLLLALLLSPWPADKHWFPPIGNLVLLIANVLALLGLTVASWRGARRAAYALLAWVPLVSLSTARAVQLSVGAPVTPWVEYGLPVVLAFAAILLALVLADRVLAERRERDRAQLHAERDALTGVFNRSGIERRLQWAVAESHRRDDVLSAVFMDLDHFKRINDSYGHGVGDACMREVVRVAGAELQYGDHMGRIGGEEFLLVLPGSNRRHARDAAERIRQAVATQCTVVAGEPVALTVSIGVAECARGDSAAALLARSDQAMYAAKHGGRNRVVVASMPAPPSAPVPEPSAPA
jgi:diguanylate cyclase (GGDEF)-like protein